MATEPKALLGVVDIDTEAAPNVEQDRLYRLWEEGNWSAKALDFTQDTTDWREKVTEYQKVAVLWNYAMFLDGEEAVTTTLAPFIEAAPLPEQKIFLATQIADEARHHVFFDRFLREVCGIGQDITSTLAATRPQLTWGYTQVFKELDRVSDQLRRTPRNLPLLAQGVTLYHLVIEGMLAHTGQHYLRDYVTRSGFLPGFAQGINLVARDESRHIAFGIQLLRELVTTNPQCKTAAIATLNRVLPWAAGVFTPPNIDWSYLTRLGYTPQEVFAFGLRSIETKLRRAGIPPSEVRELVKLGYADPHIEQANRVVALIEGGVLGTNGTPHPTENTMHTLFASMCKLATWTQASTTPVGATIQWLFDDVDPRYLHLPRTGEPSVSVGIAPTPTLTLRCTASDWIRIASGRLNQQQALLTRRLRIKGYITLALRLPRILPA